VQVLSPNRFALGLPGFSLQSLALSITVNFIAQYHLHLFACEPRKAIHKKALKYFSLIVYVLKLM
jgi:hypothetical protein